MAMLTSLPSTSANQKELFRFRVLARYLVIAGASEIFALAAIAVDVPLVPFFLMPRVGWVDWLMKLEPSGTFAIWFPELVSGTWLILAGFLMRGKRLALLYVASEIFLSFPTLLFTVELVISGGGHVLSRSHGLAMLIGACLFSFLPVVLAIRGVKKSR